MNIWEEVYSRHKKGGLVPFDQQSDQNQHFEPEHQDPSDLPAPIHLRKRIIVIARHSLLTSKRRIRSRNRKLWQNH